MLEVKRTKIPTSRQMSNMVLNLSEKFGYRSVISFQISNYTNDHSNLYDQLWLHWDAANCVSFDSWEAVQNKYFEVMS